MHVYKPESSRCVSLIYRDPLCKICRRDNTAITGRNRLKEELFPTFKCEPSALCQVGVGRTFGSVCLSVCPEHNSKTNDAKMFTLGTENDLGISYKWYGFGLKGQRSRLGLGLGLTAIRTLWVPSTLLYANERAYTFGRCKYRLVVSIQILSKFVQNLGASTATNTQRFLYT